MCDFGGEGGDPAVDSGVTATVATMGTEPSNAASEVAREFLQAWNDRERFLSEWDKWFAEEFVREDRRRLIAMPDADSSAYKEEFRSWHELTGGGHPLFDYAEVIAIHGERLGCNRTFVRWGSNISMEVLCVGQWNEDVTQVQKLVLFDADDVEAALEELDRLHLALQDDQADR
jgi:hypothetical protein